MSQARSLSDESGGTDSSDVVAGVDYGKPFSFPLDIVFEKSSDVVENYYRAVSSIIFNLKQLSESEETYQSPYDLQPILIAEGVTNDILETLPALVKTFRVKAVVDSGSLYIVDLSCGPHHSAAAGNVFQQGAQYSTDQADCMVLALSDSTHTFPGSPDLALVAEALFTPPGSHPSPRIVIAEVEVSNRSVRGMRRDYCRYFQEPSVFCVIGIKFFPDGANKATRAAAVMWTRVTAAAPIVVSAVRDFGLLPISANARRFFAEQRGLEYLPAVPHAQWRLAENRFSPVPLAAIVPAPPAPGASTAASDWIRANRIRATFDGLTRVPVLRIPGADLQARLHNIPEGTLLPDFTLNLASPLWMAARQLD